MNTKLSQLFVHLLKDKQLYHQFCEAIFSQSGYGIVELFEWSAPEDWVSVAFDWERTPEGVLCWRNFEQFWCETIKFVNPYE